ncbi:MAG: hypothetical protein PVI26_07215 [Chitinispirillia bacterium]|jgi:hypothetical protein
MKKRIDLQNIITIAFLSTSFLICIFALGFTTNLVQIRGVDRELFDMYQSFTRLTFNLSLCGIVLVIVRKFVVSQLNKRHSFLQFILGALIAAVVIGLSVHSLLKMGAFLNLYRGLNIEKVQIFYPNYRYNDSVFYIGYILNSITLLISVVFLLITGTKTSWSKINES